MAAARPHRLGRQGFSLFELLLVLLLLAVVAAIAAPATGRLLDQLAFRKETAAVLAQLRAARLHAISKGKAVNITVEPATAPWLLAGEEAPQPLATAAGLAVHFEPAVITFYPEGFATPAEIEVSRGHRSAHFTIDPLTGQPVSVS